MNNTIKKVHSFSFTTCSQLPSELVTVVNHLSSILEADSRMAEVYLKILAAYGHPPPFRSKQSYQIWVSRIMHVQS